ncbi:broad-complex core protein isoforms 1/2/3/4/5 isoform X2 [Aethina tumida]|uniref:broad-complex core protein isoforms 1/2/3/4/5 isoform X2 n=1 Tax=Aethina tumida TaxID=116153 RepID=UPI002148637B|nr:broad-complex core protein isoforms 1/2/3/4/5 isoform X2 [Aethina tumida]
MEGEQFSLCWNNFHSNLSSGFHSLLKDEDLVDCTLAAEGKYLKAHKTVLSVCSPFFKELFRVNPCKHPIVILPDVNYAALCSLLHFMYQGEVSVSQEEIPTFMRVAETLKVKGLTDNGNSSDTNGYTNSNNKHSYGMSQRELMKRPKPVKKIIRPIQQVRPASSPSPNAIKSPQHQPQLPLNQPSPSPTQQSTSGQPAAKRPHLDETPSRSPVSTPTPDPPLIKPKQEPVDHSDDAPPSEEETSMDVSHLLDTQLGETSGWPANQEAAKQMMHDTSSPAFLGGGLTLMKSGRGQLVLIHNGHIYTLCDKQDSRSVWVCVKKKTLKCEGCVTTIHGPILLSYSGHNHPQLNDVIQKLQVPSCSISPELI